MKGLPKFIIHWIYPVVVPCFVIQSLRCIPAPQPQVFHLHFRFLTITTSSHRLYYRNGKDGDHYDEKLAPPWLYCRMGLRPPLGDGCRQGMLSEIPLRHKKVHCYFLSHNSILKYYPRRDTPWLANQSKRSEYLRTRQIHAHNVVIACLPSGVYGTTLLQLSPVRCCPPSNQYGSGWWLESGEAHQSKNLIFN